MKKMIRTLAATAAFLAGAAQATLVATPTGPFVHLDDGYTASLYSLNSEGYVGITFDAAGHLIRRDAGGNGFFVHSLTADTTVHGANIHSAVEHFATGRTDFYYGVTTGKDGFLYAQGQNGLLKVDPVTFASTLIPGTSAGYYGIKTLSNGKIAYNAFDNSVHVYDPVSGTDSNIYNSGTFNDDLATTPEGYIVVAALSQCRTDIIKQDGTVVRSISSGYCADGMSYGEGHIFKNNTNGTLTRLTFADPDYQGAVTEDVIADGFGYGDLATVGPDNAFYINVQNAWFPDGNPTGGWTVVRIEKVGGGGFGDPTPTPEPASIALTGLALAGLGMARRRREARAA